MGVRPADLALIAAHAWDVHGAMQAGVKGVWVSNVEGTYAPAYGKPDLTADSLLSAAEQLGYIAQERWTLGPRWHSSPRPCGRGCSGWIINGEPCGWRGSNAPIPRARRCSVPSG